MKRFLVVYIGPGAALQKAQWTRLEEGKRKALQASGVEWGMTNSAIVDPAR